MQSTLGLILIVGVLIWANTQMRRLASALRERYFACCKVNPDFVIYPQVLNWQLCYRIFFQLVGSNSRNFKERVMHIHTIYTAGDSVDCFDGV
jgi:hypothetical protein